jgi:hypothetical protein
MADQPGHRILDPMRPRVVSLIALTAILPGAGGAQAPVSGTVLDSLVKRPLTSAAVQIVSADGSARFTRTVHSDSLGRYSIADVPAGRYLLGFLHPVLDSLGIEAPLRELLVAGPQPIRADLGTPSPLGMRAAICVNTREGRGSDSAAVIVGVVRDANGGAPIAGAQVIGEWHEMTFTKGAILRRVPRIVATSGPNGWYALCDVPSPGFVAVGAIRGADSTQRLEVQVPSERFLRRDLYLHARGTIATTRINGVVTAAIGNRPVPNAVVKFGEGQEARTNERGEWMLPDAQVGTRMIEIRALGFYPEHRAVDVVPGSAPVQSTLLTLRAVLDTARITAARVSNLHMRGFEERRQSTGIGHFMTAQDIARRRPSLISDVLRLVPGMRFERSGNDGAETMILMRATFGLEDKCTPEIFIDNRFLGYMSGEDLDMAVRPNDVAGIEVYPSSMAPAEFNRGMASSHCGVIVIWTK